MRLSETSRLRVVLQLLERWVPLPPVPPVQQVLLVTWGLLRGLELLQAVDQDTGEAAQSVRILIDRTTTPAIGTAYVFIAEAPEDVRARVVPQLTIRWAVPDGDTLKPEFDHVINSFRFTPRTSLVD